MPLRLKDAALSAFIDIAYANTVGTPIVASPTRTEDGTELGGRYTLAFSSVVAQTSATVTVSCESTTFPRNGYSTSVALDGSTAYTNIVPGASIVFSNSASFTSSWTGYVDLGDWFGLINAGAGAGTGVRVAAVNTGSTTLTGCYAVINRPKALLWRKVGQGVFKSVKVFTTGADEKEDGSLVTQPYAITCANLNTTPNPDVIDILVDGVKITTVLNVDTGATSDSLGLARDGTTRYQVQTGGLEGLEFVIHASAGNSDTANVLIWQNRHIQTAPDNSGSAGTYSYTADVQLTQSGQTAGTIQASQAAYFWYRTNVATGASPNKNAHPLNVYLKYADTGMANFTG